MSNQKQWVFAPRPLIYSIFCLHQQMNMEKKELNPYFYSKIQKNNKIMTNFKIFEKKNENFATLKKTSPKEHPRHRFLIFHRLCYVKGDAKKGNTYNIF